MIKIAFAIVVILHGMVHLLYFGQSRAMFELQPGMRWPADSWALPALLGVAWTRWLGAGACVLIAAGFVAGGAGLLAGQSWWRPLVVGSAVFSIVVFLLLWDGRWHDLADQGGVNLLINAAILAILLLL